MFDTLMLLVVASLAFRLSGSLGAGRFRSPRVSAAHGLAIMLLATGSAHFVPDSVTVMPGHTDLVAMVPPIVPFPSQAVYTTGVLELLGALGLVLSRTRRAAGACLAALFVLMLPANIHAGLAEVPFDGHAATPLWFRVPEQAVYIAVALWAAGVTRRTVARRRAHPLPTPSRR
ncbi:hypothetical protein GCM10010271_06270 [Streptomyces kurssanovii]|nr:hypothetical protein GCM10010271_06270 [Streptomyces kurssanovii]